MRLNFKRYFCVTWFGILVVLATAACTPEPTPTPLPDPAIARISFTASPSPTATRTPAPTKTPSPLWTIAPTLSPTATTDPYLDFYIETLRQRTYGGGVLEDLGRLNAASGFSRRLFKYRSEGLDMFGFINIPEGAGPFPVVVMLHGYVDPEAYTTLDYSTRYADALTEEGFIVVHPNLRGYNPSEDGANQLGIGDTVDILNLISLIRQQSGSPGLLEKTDGKAIGLWGHSMGGGIAMRVAVIDSDIDAMLLYASIHANEEFNLAHFDKDGRGKEKIDAPVESLKKISPLTYLDEIDFPISIHHGTSDSVVPVSWSEFLCSFFTEKEKAVSCMEYEGQPHTFRNSGDTKFIAEMNRFFTSHMK